MSMILQNVKYIRTQAEQEHFSAKMVFNDSGAIFFAESKQHRDMKLPGISYEDEYRGNALAAMISPGRIEIRYHVDFSDARVATIVRDLKQHPDLSFLASWQVTYQGRAVHPS